MPDNSTVEFNPKYLFSLKYKYSGKICPESVCLCFRNLYLKKII